MELRLLCFVCLLTAAQSQGGDDQKKNLISIDDKKIAKCNGANWDGPTVPLPLAKSGVYTCKDCDDDSCDGEKLVVKVRSVEDLVELEVGALVSVLVSDVAVTALIGWAVYSICAQPRARGGLQSKASDKVALIPNSAGDTYQPLSVRSDEYSTLNAQRKHKNKHNSSA